MKLIKNIFFYLGWIWGTKIVINKAAYLQFYFRQNNYINKSSVFKSNSHTFYLLDVFTPVILMAILVVAMFLFLWYGHKHISNRNTWLEFLILIIYALSIIGGGYSSRMRYIFADKFFSIPLETRVYYQYYSGFLIGNALIILFWRIYQKKCDK